MTVQHLDPRIRTVWRVATAVTALVLTTVATTAVVLLGLGEDGPPPEFAGAVFLAGAVVGSVVAWWTPDLRYRHWTYEVAQEAMELRHGVVMRTASSIPYFRVQHVDTQQGPIDRRLGVASLKLHTASAATDALLPGLAVEDAEELRRTILERAGAGDAV